jgi:uncharacterized membrane protein YgcG
MKNQKQTRTLAVALLVMTAVLYFSCRKADQFQSSLAETTVLQVENRFFHEHSNSDSTVTALMEYFERKNEGEHFVAKTVERIGYPYWDKALSLQRAAQTNAVGTNSTGAKKTGTVTTPSSTTVYVPFVRDDENQVNAALMFTVTPTDTSFLYVCDWQYKDKEHGMVSMAGTAENHAVFFMMLDKRTLGHKTFTITDKKLFSKPGSKESVKRVSFDLPVQNATRVSYYAVLCYPISVCGSPGSADCSGLDGCDYARGCSGGNMCYPAEHCDAVWLGTSGGSGSSSGSSNGGSSGGGGSNGGSNNNSMPPDCSDPANKHSGDCEEGWEPAEAPFIWEYTGDDGSSFIDSDPAKEVDLQFDPNDQINTLYPNLYQLVKNLKSFVKSSPEVMAALIYWSGFSKQQILEKLTFGTGPVVKVVDGLDAYSSYNKTTGENVLKISGSWVRGLEAAVLPGTKRGTAFVVAVAILHEFVHFGTGQHNVDEGKFDFGWGFERTAFKVIVDAKNANEVSIQFKKLP